VSAVSCINCTGTCVGQFGPLCKLKYVHHPHSTRRLNSPVPLQSVVTTCYLNLIIRPQSPNVAADSPELFWIFKCPCLHLHTAVFDDDDDDAVTLPKLFKCTSAVFWYSFMFRFLVLLSACRLALIHVFLWHFCDGPSHKATSASFPGLSISLFSNFNIV
jgi:hypothetical protein